MFPSNFVAVIEGDEEGESSDKTDGAEAKENELPPLPAEKPKPSRVKGVGFGNIFAGGEVKLRKIGSNSTAEHPKKDTPSAGQNELAQKRLSLKRAVPVPTPKAVTNAEAKAKEEPRKETKQEVKKEEKKEVKKEEEEEFEEIIKQRAKATFPYEAQHSDELELKEGDIVTIIDKEAADSGWWLGEIDGRKGVFPDNFVTMLPPEKEKVKKKVPVQMPARPISVVPRPTPTETKQAISRPLMTRPSQDSPAPPKPSQPPTSSSHETASVPAKDDSNRRPSYPTTQPKDDTNRRPSHPIAAPKPTKKALPIPAKKPALKSKPPPPKPAGPPPSGPPPSGPHPAEREEPQPAVVLRRRPPVNETKEETEGSLDDLKTESPQKLTHITLSRPKNANRRPPSVFGGQGGNLSDALPVQNGTAVPPPRPKSSPIGPSVVPGLVQPHSVIGTTPKGHTEPNPAPGPVKSRPASLVSDASHASNAQVDELKKDIKALQEQMASMKSDLKKEVVKLMTELDEEKKHRMAMQVELDRIKKLVLEKD